MVSSIQSVIHVMVEIPLIFGETNFMEVPKIRKMCSPRKRQPMVATDVKVMEDLVVAQLS